MRLFLRASAKNGLTLLLMQHDARPAKGVDRVGPADMNLLFEQRFYTDELPIVAADASHQPLCLPLAMDDPSQSYDGKLQYPIAVRGSFALRMVLRLIASAHAGPCSIPFECIYVDSVPVCRPADGRPGYEQCLFRVPIRLTPDWSHITLTYQDGIVASSAMDDGTAGNVPHFSLDLAEFSLRKSLPAGAIHHAPPRRPARGHLKRRLAMTAVSG